ncbi:hypothetical protein [Paraburkholderia panacisoli]|jgi:hypothetical protein|uniref:hypothetical protein n=1 Tax=Paraburkholderia panacisoli TaxID=2603818 RepID=UPI00165F26EE|nr:hypothetical protein [Paraburkholderia panacisoli]
MASSNAPDFPTYPPSNAGSPAFAIEWASAWGTGNRVFAGIFNVESSEVECALHVAQLPNIEIVACMAHLGPTDAEAFATAAVVSSETADQSRFDLRKTRRGSRVQAAKAFVLVVCVNRVQ